MALLRTSSPPYVFYAEKEPTIACRDCERFGEHRIRGHDYVRKCTRYNCQAKKHLPENPPVLDLLEKIPDRPIN